MRKITSKKIRKYVQTLSGKLDINGNEPELKKTYRQVKKFLVRIDHKSRTGILEKMSKGEDIPIKKV